MTDPLDDGLDALMEGDIDLPDGFTWLPRTQPVGVIQAHRHQPSRRRQEDHRHRGALAGVLDPLPAEGESVHLVLNGGVALGDVLWSVVDGTRLPGPLTVSTLGFGRRWIAGLIDRLRDGRITSGVVVCSNYFRKSDPTEYADAAAALAQWPVTLTDARTHAKIAVFGHFSLEGSANLRSCRSIENVAVTHDENLARFHAKWISEIAHKPTSTPWTTRTTSETPPKTCF
jgi:hypothetical protein